MSLVFPSCLPVTLVSPSWVSWYESLCATFSSLLEVLWRRAVQATVVDRNPHAESFEISGTGRSTTAPYPQGEPNAYDVHICPGAVSHRAWLTCDWLKLLPGAVVFTTCQTHSMVSRTALESLNNNNSTDLQHMVSRTALENFNNRQRENEILPNTRVPQQQQHMVSRTVLENLTPEQQQLDEFEVRPRTSLVTTLTWNLVERIPSQ